MIAFARWRGRVKPPGEVVLSNVQVRGGAEYWRDFIDLDVAHLIDAIVTSFDVGFRKPHLAMFDAGLQSAGCAAAECLMIGVSEVKDIQPRLRRLDP